MSLEFSDTTNNDGLVQHFEIEVGGIDGLAAFSGNTTNLKVVTALINQALDDFWNIAIPASGKWQLDDSNQTDYPIVSTNLIASQRDYSFTVDASSNLILDIYRVFVLTSATGTQYREIYPVDAQSDIETWGLTDGQNLEGPPYRYDKTANGIFLDPIPSYSATNGLKLYINREASYFTTASTTKKPGVPGVLHKYFYLKAASEYARMNTLSVYPGLEREVIKYEGVNGSGGIIREHFGYRARDERKRLTMAKNNFW